MKAVLGAALMAGLCVALTPDVTRADMLPDVIEIAPGAPRLLTDPFLQAPEPGGVRVVWMTNFAGTAHQVVLKDAPGAEVTVTSKKLREMYAGPRSQVADPPVQVMRRPVWRHEAHVRGLVAGTPVPYRVSSTAADGSVHGAGPFLLRPAPAPAQGLHILLTSDMQQKPMSLVNYAAVARTYPDLDAVFFAGDMVNRHRAASDWFDNFRSEWRDAPDRAQVPFFPALQGTFDRLLPEAVAPGGAILQNAPLFPTVGNHEVSGRFRPNVTITRNGQDHFTDVQWMDNDPQPRWFAEWRYAQLAPEVNPAADPAQREDWIAANSHEHRTYDELFTLPGTGPEGKGYYATRLGDVFLVSMNVSRIWRPWGTGPDDGGKLKEADRDVNRPEEWGFGEFIFTPFHAGTTQYDWLRRVLASDAAQGAKYRVVMAHQSVHGLGDNAAPAHVDPVMHVDWTDAGGEVRQITFTLPADPALRAAAFGREVAPLVGRITQVRYSYDLVQDHFRRDIEPLLHLHDVDLLLTGHSHVWTRSKTATLNFLETSNVGNCFGAMWTLPGGGTFRDQVRGGKWKSFAASMAAQEAPWHPADYPGTGEPYGRAPIQPTEFNPMVEMAGAEVEMPFLCSNDLTAFSILDTKAGEVRSYVLSASQPHGNPRLFDRFSLDD
jgi:hypothetical protein